MNGDWEAWIDFFLEGVRTTARGAVTTAQRLVELFSGEEAKIQTSGRAAGSALRVHSALRERPILSLPDICRRTGLSSRRQPTGWRCLKSWGLSANSPADSGTDSSPMIVICRSSARAQNRCDPTGAEVDMNVTTPIWAIELLCVEARMPSCLAEAGHSRRVGPQRWGIVWRGDSRYS